MARRSTQLQFIERATRKHKSVYDYDKVTYVNMQTKVEIVCKIHGSFWQTPMCHLQGQSCKACKNQRLNKKIFAVRSNKIHTFKYNYALVNYINNWTRVIIICPVHGIFKQLPNVHLDGHGCPKCKGGIKYTQADFLQKGYLVHKDKYDYSKVVYVDSTKLVEIICANHGSFLQTPANHLSGQSCPKCVVTSTEEKRIRLYMDRNDIVYISQKTFADCINPRTGYKLRFDFYLPNQNILIEFDGSHHFESVNAWKEAGILEYTHYKDIIKNKFAYERGIQLCRISYKEKKNIEFILDKLLH